MLDFNLYQQENTIRNGMLHNHQGQAVRFKRCLTMFQNAHVNGKFFRLMQHIQRKSIHLLELPHLQESQAVNRHYIGIHPVQLNQICGSLGREKDFDSHFHPLRERARDRWVGIAMARLQHDALDAVELIQLGDCFYVVDGHHRVSVAYALHEKFIDAEITVWENRAAEPCCPQIVAPPILTSPSL